MAAKQEAQIPIRPGEKAPDQEFRRALFRRYIAAIASRKGFVALGIGLFANLLMHHWLFDRLSSAVGLYRSMVLIIAGLSVDYYLLVLTSIVYGVYRRFKDTGFYQDLQLTGVTPWEALRPLVLIIFLLVLADTIVEAGVALFFHNEAPIIQLVALLTTFFYGFGAGAWISHMLVLMNQLRLFATAQFFVILSLGFLTLLAISTLADNWQYSLRNWSSDADWKIRIVEVATVGNSELWPMYSPHYAYYAALACATFLFGAGSIILHAIVRRLSYRAYGSPGIQSPP